MKTADAQKIEEAKVAFLAAQTKRQTKAALLCLLTVFAVFVLPRFFSSPISGIVLVVGGAVSFTSYFLIYQQSLRTRTGSLTLAYCLLAYMWLCAAIVALLSFTARIE
jgi:drug/metabolite transporter (DMT)-like permease